MDSIVGIGNIGLSSAGWVWIDSGGALAGLSSGGGGGGEAGVGSVISVLREAFFELEIHARHGKHRFVRVWRLGLHGRLDWLDRRLSAGWDGGRMHHELPS